ncbi:MAG: hypothetical protein HDS82_05855 [Bacteroidales bacterium]|nr:hypothetical protein [Bacteroidales bacterium]
MKKSLLKIFVTCAVMGLTPLFSSCVVDDDGWYPAPPSGWHNYFYDSSLYGRWELVQANGMPVGPYDTNYMDFYGDGRGTYYYYDRGNLYSEDMAYYCQYSDFGPSDTQINVQYEYGNPVTMWYWFVGSSLYMQWNTSNGRTTYIYRPVSYVPY